MSNERDVVNIQTDIALIKKDVKQIERLFTKIDTAVDTISDISQKVAVQGEVLKNQTVWLNDLEERIEQHREEDIKRTEFIHARLDEYRESSKMDHQRLADESAKNRKERNEEIMGELGKMNNNLESRIGNIDNRIKLLENRIVELEKWKWYIMGLGAVLMFLAVQIDLKTVFG